MTDTTDTAPEPIPDIPVAEDSVPSGTPAPPDAVDEGPSADALAALAEADAVRSQFAQLTASAAEHGMEVVQRLVDGEWQIGMQPKQGARQAAVPVPSNVSPLRPSGSAASRQPELDPSKMSTAEKSAAYRSMLEKGA